MSVVEDERTKLLANALNTACTSGVTVGLFTPVAALLHDLGGARAAIGLGTLSLGTGNPG